MWQRNLLGFATPEEAAEWALQHPFTLDAIIELQHLPQNNASEDSSAEGEPVCLPALCFGVMYESQCFEMCPMDVGQVLYVIFHVPEMRPMIVGHLHGQGRCIVGQQQQGCPGVSHMLAEGWWPGPERPRRHFGPKATASSAAEHIKT